MRSTAASAVLLCLLALPVAIGSPAVAGDRVVLAQAAGPTPPPSDAPVHGADESNDAARRVLERREYQPARRGLLQRLRENARAWVATQISRLLSGSRGSVFAWGVVVAGALAAALILWRVLRTMGRDPTRHAEVELAPTARTPGEWWERSRRAEERGDLTLAVKLAYHAVVATLAADGLVDGSDGSTIGEHRRELRANAPTSSGAFDQAALRVESVLYGSAAATPADLELLRAMSTPRTGVWS